MLLEISAGISQLLFVWTFDGASDVVFFVGLEEQTLGFFACVEY